MVSSVFVGDARTDMEDVQGKGGGGFANTNCYENPAFSEANRNLSQRSLRKGFDDFEEIPEHKASTLCQTLSDLLDSTKAKLKKVCTRRTLKKRLPILTWLPQYSSQDVVGDFVAGITVGLTVIPQSLAYAGIAHVPLQYGLYTSFLGCLVYIFLGTCKDVPFGPTAIASLMTYEVTVGRGPENAIILCFLSGLIQFLMGVFGFGFIIDFVSGPVSSGFTSAVALIILTSQVSNLLGITTSGTIFTHQWSSIVDNLHLTNHWDAILGLICIIILLVLRIGSSIQISADDGHGHKLNKFQFWRNRLFWFIATSRSAILVIICGFIGYAFFEQGEEPFTLIGEVPAGLPDIRVPFFSYTRLEGNVTVVMGFEDIISELGSNIIVVPLLSLLENIAICKVFAEGKTVDSSQEFMAIGMCNICNSFVQAFPATGSVARSALQHGSGARTPLCGLYTGSLVILALLFFTPYFYFIPKAALGAVIIAAVIFMVEVRVVKPMWKSKKSDFLLGLGTFIACLVFPLEVGVSLGIGVNLIFILHQAARPKISIERLQTKHGKEYLMIIPDRCLIFPSVDYVKNLVTKHSTREKVPVVIDCSYIYGADYTAACVIEVLTADFASRNQPFVFYNLQPSVISVFEGLNPKDFEVVYNEEGLQQAIEHESFSMKIP